MRLCVLCKYFLFSMGSPGYSDMTPGSDASISCMKLHWEMSNYGDVDEYRANIIMADTCPDYEEAQLAQEQNQ